MSWTDTPVISQVKLPSGSTYYFKDDDARANITALNTAVEALGNPFTYTVSTNAATTPSGVIAIFSGTTETTGTLAASADTENKIYLVPEKGVKSGSYNEYITIKTGSSTYVWEKIGSTAADFGTLAGKNSVSVQYTKANANTGNSTAFNSGNASLQPAGTVSTPSFTGTTATITVSGTPTGSVSIAINGSGVTKNYTPAGTVSQPTFTGTTATINISGSTSGVAVGDHSYQPAGTVSKPSWTGTKATITHSVTQGTVSAEGSYQPAGSVSKPNITLTPTKTSVYSITDVGSLPSHGADSHTNTGFSVSNELLTITDGSFTSGAWSAGSLPTKGSAVNAYTGLTAALAANPAFTGTTATISVSGSTSGVAVADHVYTPAGGLSAAPTFTGTTATITHSVTQGTFSGSAEYQPAGTVSKPTFSGTSAAISGSFSGTSFSSTGSYQPAGTVSQPTFTGTTATHSHSVGAHSHSIGGTSTAATVSYT
jgi:hypothetical protein